MVDRPQPKAKTQQVDQAEDPHHPERLLDELPPAAKRLRRFQGAGMADPIGVAVRHRDVGKRVKTPLTFRMGREHILAPRSEEHTSELQSLMRSSYADFCLKKKKLKSLTRT